MVLVEEPAFASYGFGGRAGLQAGVKTRNHEGFSPGGERPPGLKPSAIIVGFSPRGRIFNHDYVANEVSSHLPVLVIPETAPLLRLAPAKDVTVLTPAPCKKSKERRTPSFLRRSPSRYTFDRRPGHSEPCLIGRHPFGHPPSVVPLHVP